MISRWNFESDRQLRICQNTMCRADDLQIADKAASNVDKTGIINRWSLGLYVAGVVFVLTRLSAIEVRLLASKTTAKCIERDHPLDSEAIQRNTYPLWSIYLTLRAYVSVIDFLLIFVTGTGL